MITETFRSKKNNPQEALRTAVVEEHRLASRFGLGQTRYVVTLKRETRYRTSERTERMANRKDAFALARGFVAGQIK